MIVFFLFFLPLDSDLQAVAQERVDWMSVHHHCWHPPFRIARLWARHGPNKNKRVRFEGAGWGRRSRDPKNLGTCRPRRRLTLAADAVARGPRGTYRIRLWK